MPAKHTGHLAEHARKRHNQTLQRAQKTLTELADAGEPVTIARLANHAGVSRSWLYTQPELLTRIEQLRCERSRTSTTRPTHNTRASMESLHRRLELAQQHIRQLRAENHQLRDELARAHGQLRAAACDRRDLQL